MILFLIPHQFYPFFLPYHQLGLVLIVQKKKKPFLIFNYFQLFATILWIQIGLHINVSGVSG